MNQIIELNYGYAEYGNGLIINTLVNEFRDPTSSDHSL